jgi:translation elongation factor EF-1alpha
MAVDTRKKPVNIVFVGHVDVGKSTICGNIFIKNK